MKPVPALILYFLFISALFTGCAREQAGLEEKGDQAFAQAHYSMAVRFWTQAVAESGDSPGLFYKIGNAHLKLADLDLAGKAFSKAHQLDSLDSAIEKDLVRILLLKGDHARALPHLEQLFAREAKDSDVFLLFGDYYVLSNDFGLALNMYEKARGLDLINDRALIKTAICHVRTKDLKTAGRLVSGLKMDHLLSSDLMLLSDYYFLVEDLDTAEKCQLAAVGKDPENLMHKVSLCRFYLECGMKEKAKAFLLELLERYPDDLRFPLMLADFHISEKNLALAQQRLQDLGATVKNMADYHLLMGKIWLFQGKTAHAVSSLKTAVDMNFSLISGHYLLGVAYFAGGQTKLAENSFVRARALYSGHLESLLALSGLHYKKREYDLALQYLEEALSLSPLNPRGYVLKGLCLMETGKPSRAAAAFSKAWHLGREPSALYFLARAFECGKEEDKAAVLYRRILDEHPDMGQALFDYAGLMLDLDKGREVLGQIKEMIRQNGPSQDVLYTAAWLSFRLNQLEASLEYLKPIGKGPDIPSHVFSLLADVYEKNGQAEPLEATLKQWMDTKSGCHRAATRLAEFYVGSGRTDLARGFLEQVCEKFSDDPHIAGNLAWLYVQSGTELDKALNLARKAYEKLPDEPWLKDTLGWIYYQKGSYAQARWLLSEAEQKAPETGIVKFHLGMALFKLGQFEKAKEMLNACLELDLGITDQELAKQTLAELGSPKEREEFTEDMIFDPEKAMPFANGADEDSGLGTGDDDDILQPDWSKVK